MNGACVLIRLQQNGGFRQILAEVLLGRPGHVADDLTRWLLNTSSNSSV